MLAGRSPPSADVSTAGDSVASASDQACRRGAAGPGSLAGLLAGADVCTLSGASPQRSLMSKSIQAPLESARVASLATRPVWPFLRRLDAHHGPRQDRGMTPSMVAHAKVPALPGAWCRQSCGAGCTRGAEHRPLVGLQAGANELSDQRGCNAVPDCTEHSCLTGSPRLAVQVGMRGSRLGRARTLSLGPGLLQQ